METAISTGAGSTRSRSHTRAQPIAAPSAAPAPMAQRRRPAASSGCGAPVSSDPTTSERALSATTRETISRAFSASATTRGTWGCPLASWNSRVSNTAATTPSSSAGAQPSPGSSSHRAAAATARMVQTDIKAPTSDARHQREAQQVHRGLHRPGVEQRREEQGKQELRVHSHRRQAGQEGAAEAGAGQQEDLRQARQLRQRQQRPDRGEDERDELQFAHGAAARSTGVASPPARRISTSPDAGGAGTVRTGSRPSVLRPLRARQRLAIGA